MRSDNGRRLNAVYSITGFEALLLRPTVVWSCSLIAGIAMYFLNINNDTVIISVILFVSGALIIIGYRAYSSGLKKSIALLTVVLISPAFVVAGLWRARACDEESPLKQALVKQTAAEVSGCIYGISVTEEGYRLELTDVEAILTESGRNGSKTLEENSGTTTTVQDSGIMTKGQEVRRDDRLEGDRIYVIIEDIYSYEPQIGDCIIASGKMYPNLKATNPGQFDSDRYYRTRHVDGKIYAEDIYCYDVRKGIGISVRRLLCRLSMGFADGLHRVLPEREAGVMTAMLTGDRGRLDTDLKNLYSEGGIAHILSISALHVTLIGMGLFKLLMKLFGRLKLSVSATIAVMFLYGVMTGFSVSTRRAVLMLVIMLTAKLIGKPYDMLSACGLAAIVILLLEPGYLLDSGFQLSFLSVLGIHFSIRIIARFELKNRFVNAFLPSLSVTLFTTPVIMNTYFRITPYSVFANLIVLPLMSILLVLGFVAGMLGFPITVTAGRFVAGPVYYILRMFEELCEAEEKLPYSQVVTGAPGRVTIVAYYVLLFLVMAVLLGRNYNPNRFIGLNRRAALKKRRKRLWFASLLIGCGVVFYRPECEGIATYFLDVGQGLCCIIETKDGFTMFDGGSTSITAPGSRIISQFLKWKGVTVLDTVFFSHTDDDHVNGIIEMLEEGYPEIGQVICGCNVDDESEILSACREAEVKIVRISAGEYVEISAGEEDETGGWAKNNPTADREGKTVVRENDDPKVSENDDPKALKNDEQGARKKDEIGALEKSGKLPLVIRCIAPEADIEYADINAGSVVLEVIYGEYSMLLTGDSDFFSEYRYLRRLSLEKFDVLQVAHHGSKNSSSDVILRYINPTVGVISCAEYNYYGHPSKVTLARLEAADCAVYGTYEGGMITVRSDGDGIFEVEEYVK